MQITMKFLKLIVYTKYILALPYFLYVSYLVLDCVIKNKDLGGRSIFSLSDLFVYTLPWSIFISIFIESKMDVNDYSSYSMYIKISGILYFIAIIINTVILFFIGKWIHKGILTILSVVT